MSEHEVAEILDELFGYESACDFNGIDEWLPPKCEYAETECPHKDTAKCWEQYLKHRN